MGWTDLIAADALKAKGKAVVRHHGRQILIIAMPKGVKALANRCPHEGYPLSEGVLGEDCVLTCNWHNWKFDLASGETLGGRDRLSQWPAKVEAGRVLVDLTPEDPCARRERVMAGLVQGLRYEDQERIVRESARLMQLPGDPADAVRVALDWAADRFEFGTTHAVAGAPDWLGLFDKKSLKADERLAALGEVVGHIADDARGARYPLPTGEAPWDAGAFLAAVEGEDEAAAIALIRGALADGLTATDLLPTLARAALSHYADFGHSLIYVIKTEALVRRLGEPSAALLLGQLARSLIYARREDLLPEFRDYAARLSAWGAASRTVQPLDAKALRGRSARQCMALVSAWGAIHAPEAIFAVLVEASAWTLLHVDEPVLLRTDGKLADNVGWLDFTHALTFADAGTVAVRLLPDLWPALLLQLACFVGRN
ncbi:MAG TPA: Rieske (2Fe-2S) protein, partial [Caulobacteraceae bacterium]|nr:Rieske (2Fe-2S) protein [Caulobacteraceae bacterium]